MMSFSENPRTYPCFNLIKGSCVIMIVNRPTGLGKEASGQSLKKEGKLHSIEKDNTLGFCHPL